VRFSCEFSENATGRVVHREAWVNATGCTVAGLSNDATWVETRSVAPMDPAPTPWSPSNPFLYTVSCTVTAVVAAGNRAHLETTTEETTRPVRRGGANGTSLESRFGFRTFSRDSRGRLLLNGVPVFLRGNSINPPGRWGLPSDLSESHTFAREYLAFLKRNASVNAVRVGDGATHLTENWYNAADELGMLIYAGPYGNPPCPGCRVTPAVDPPPEGSEDVLVAKYEQVLRASAPHPSHVVLILTNELDFNVDGHHGYSPYGPEYASLVHNVTARLRTYDPARLYLGNAGFGQGKGGDLLDDHTYYGWYNGDVVSYYSDARPISNQPYTFTECVGNYITAAGDYDVSGKNLAWTIKWTGLVQGGGEGAEHLRSVTKESLEIVRRFRSVNPQLAGIMPFSSPFYVCGTDVASFDDLMRLGLVSPSVQQMATSFAPLLVSVELWVRHVSTQTHALRGVIHVVNDADSLLPLASGWSVRLTSTAVTASRSGLSQSRWGGAEQPDACASSILRGRACEGACGDPLPSVPYFGTASTPFELPTSGCVPGVHTLTVTLVSASGEDVAVNHEQFEIFSYARPTRHSLGGQADPLLESQIDSLGGRKDSHDHRTESLLGGLTNPHHEGAAGLGVVLVDCPSGATAKALATLGVHIESTLLDLSDLPTRDPTMSVVVVGEDAWSPTVHAQRQALGIWVARGGRVLLMQQSGATANLTLDWAPAGAALQVAPTNELTCHSGATEGCLAVGWGQPLHVTRPDHPMFTTPHKVDARQLAQWNDYTGWSESNRTAGPVPRLSPVAQALTIDTASADPQSWTVIHQTRRQTAVLAAHAIGLQHQVVVEMRGAAAGGGGGGGVHGGGLVVFFGVDAVRRVGVDPVAEHVLENALAYVRDNSTATSQSTSTTRGSANGSGGMSREVTPLQPVFAVGDTITWGDYASERGVAIANLEGLLVQACPYNASCKSGWLGNKACGRTPLGPFNWTFMGHNTDLDPANATAWAVVWATAAAGVSKVVTTWLPPSSSTASDPLSALAPLSTFRLAVVDPKTWTPGTPDMCVVDNTARRAECVVPVPSAQGARTVIELHMTMPKGATLQTTSFVN
jgi:beta-galactosidase